MTEPAELPTLLDISAQVAWPDTDAEATTLARLRAAGLGDGTLGRLGELAGWLSGVQGVSPPREPQRPRLILFRAGDAGGADVASVFADVAGVGVRVVDLAADTSRANTASADTRSTDTPSADTLRPDPPSADTPSTDTPSTDTPSTDTPAADLPAEGSTADELVRTGNALSAAAVDAAIRAGAAVADDETDSGADLLLAAAGPAGPIPDVVVSIMALVEPVKAVGLSTILSDAEWMSWVAGVRDARLRGLPYRHEVADLLATVGGLELAALTGFLLRAAARRTPVVLDGVTAAAAALLAREITPNVVRWWQPGAASTRPAHALALQEFVGVPILDLRLRVEEGVGALLAVQVLRAAARAVTELTVALPDAAEPDDTPFNDDDAT